MGLRLGGHARNLPCPGWPRSPNDPCRSRRKRTRTGRSADLCGTLGRRRPRGHDPDAARSRNRFQRSGAAMKRETIPSEKLPISETVIDKPRKARKLNGPGTDCEGVTLDDFHAYMPQHSYIFVPSRDMWPASSVNARIAPFPMLDRNGKPIVDENGKPKRTSASAWLDRNKPIEQATWAPGLPTLIKNRLISEGGWIERDGVTCFNLYRPPTIVLGDPNEAGPWLDHVGKVFGDDASHIIHWLAQRVQRPYEKINHALVLGGNQGIGKDTPLEPVKQAIGPWNFTEVSPQHLLSRFNGFLKSVILRV